MLRRSCGRLEAYGFIGLGQMGGRMAANMWKDPNCTELHVFDVSEANVKDMLANCSPENAAKVVVCADPSKVAAASKKIVTMLPNADIVGKVFRDPTTGLFSTMQKGTLVVDSSTTGPLISQELAKEIATYGSRFIDAPVSGGVMGAAAGTLTFMVGADDDAAFSDAKAFLTPMAKNIIHCGKVSGGQVVKLCNNMVLAQHMISIAEGMVMGVKLGVDPKVLAGIFNTSTARCWSGDTCNPYPGVMDNVPASREYSGGFGSALMLKDLKLAMDAAKMANFSPPGGETATAVYSDMVNEKNMGGLDFSSVLKYLNERK